MFVQLTLTNAKKTAIYFGNGGVIKLITIDNVTSCLNSSNNPVAVVLETVEQISEMIGAKSFVSTKTKESNHYFND